MSTSFPNLGKYQILEEIGRGGMGAVYKGHDPFLNRQVAIKLLAPHLVWEKAFVERFMREARAVAQLHHPNIVSIYDVGQDGNNYYFVMAYLPGGSLKQLITQRGRLTPAEALPILRQLADALDYAHGKGLVHRDVKPVNVMFDERSQVILTDFGIVKAVEESRLTGTGAAIGTPHYMSPEQIKGMEVDARTDQYALGIVAFEMLTGRVPFDADTTTAILFKQVSEPPPSATACCPDLPPTVEPALNRALAKSPAERYASCGDFVSALELALGQLVVQRPVAPSPIATRPAQPTAPASTMSSAARRGLPGWAWAIGAGGLLMCLIAVVIAAVGIKALGPKLTTTTPTQAVAIRNTTVPVSTQAPPSLPPSATAPRSTPTRLPSSAVNTPMASPALGSTVVPQPVAAISSANVEQVAQLALLEKDSGENVVWLPKSKLLVVSASKIFFYDPQTLKQTRAIDARGENLAFSPDEAVLASVSSDGVKLWDVNGTELRALAGSKSSTSAAFSSDGKTLATGTGMTVKLWEVVSGNELRTLVGHSSPVNAVAFSPDGTTLASGADSVKLWDTASWSELRTLGDRMPSVQSLAFSPDGQMLAGGTVFGEIKLWEAASGRELHTFTGHTSWVHSVAFSPDGKLLASAAWDATIRLWDVASGRELRALTGHTDRVQAVTFSPDGLFLASGASDRTTRLWGVKSATTQTGPTPTRAPSAPTGTPVPLSASAISPANAEKVTQLTLLEKDAGENVAWLPDGKLVTVASNKVYVYDPQTWQQVRTINASGGVAIFSRDGATMAMVSYDGVKLWDAVSGSELRTLAGSKSSTSAAFSPDGTLLATGTGMTVKVWDVASGDELRTLAGSQSTVNAVAFSPDGKALAAAANTIKLWDTASWSELRTLGNQSGVQSLAFSPDGQTLAAGATNGAITLFEVSSGRQLRNLTGHKSWVHGVAFSPDGKLLASAAWDTTIRLWEVASGRELRTLTGHTDRAQTVAFSPDGAILASGASDRTTRLWGIK